MDGIKEPKRLKASSLVETIVGLMVIVLVFGIAMTVYVNVMRNSTSLAELKASQRLEEIAVETKTKKSFFNESFEEGGVKIEKTIGKYQDKEGLFLLELIAKDPTERKLAERKEIISENLND